MIGRRARWALSVGLVGAVALSVPGSWPHEAQDRVSPVSPGSSALARARKVKRRMVALSGAEREEAREGAIRAYERVWSAEGSPLRIATEAAFRAGELARAGGQLERARALFRRAARAQLQGFSARARLELAHLDRRAEDWDGAIRGYEGLLLAGCDDPYLCDEALFWLARAQREAGRERLAEGALKLLVQRVAAGSLRKRVFRELARAELVD